MADRSTLLLFLICMLSPFVMAACDGSNNAPPSASRDLITPEIRVAIEAGDLAALSDSDLPEIPGIDGFIIDHDMAVVLGKAFFWEMYAGNNGQACASCHFHAGTDRRIQNTLHPGGKDEIFFRETPPLSNIHCSCLTRYAAVTPGDQTTS